MFRQLRLFFEDMNIISRANGYVQCGLISTRTCEALLKAYGVEGFE